MVATVLGTHGSGTHAARPAGNAVPDGSLYSCSTHSLIYVSNYAGNSWSTWASLTGTGMTNPMSNKGELIQGDTAGAAVALTTGTAGQALVSGGAGAFNSWGRPNGALVDHAKAITTGGDLTLNNTSWTSLDTGLDLVMTAATSDIIEVSFSGTCNGAATGLGIDAASLVAGNPVNYVSGVATASHGSDLGVSAWFMPSNGGNGSSAGGSVMYTLQAGDISAGTVTIRFFYRTSSATNKVLNRTQAVPLQVWAKNLGPAI